MYSPVLHDHLITSFSLLFCFDDVVSIIASSYHVALTYSNEDGSLQVDESFFFEDVSYSFDFKFS